MNKSVNNIIYIIHGESIDLSIEFHENNTVVDGNELITSWSILKYPSKGIVIAETDGVAGSDITIPSSATEDLLGEYILRLKVKHNSKVLIEDRKLEVSK